MYVRTYVRTYVCMYVCMYVYMYVYVCVSTLSYVVCTHYKISTKNVGTLSLQMHSRFVLAYHPEIWSKNGRLLTAIASSVLRARAFL